MSICGLQSDAMATEGDPTNLVKVLHLMVLSFSWGMQLWVSFIAGMRCKSSWLELCIPALMLYLTTDPSILTVMSVPAGFALVKQVTLHTFGLVQSKLFPVYFYCLLGCNVVSLAVYAVYHPRELLDWHESLQVKHHTYIQYIEFIPVQSNTGSMYQILLC